MSLDDNIKSYLRQYATDAKYDNEYMAAERAVGRIKQAFADEGYCSPLHSHIYGGDGMNKLCMTGQEWYDRFLKELPATGLMWDIDETDDTPAKYKIRGHILKAARKASGIEE